MLRIDILIDDAKCREDVSQLRWPSGVRLRLVSTKLDLTMRTGVNGSVFGNSTIASSVRAVLTI